ncbi:MAG: MFS transporter [Cyclobacteriaceae bacterium]|nr:MFS transporter [Cyclobacteriaceae bacterium]
MGQKIAFGVGMLANQMFPAVLGIFMTVLIKDLGFPGWMWGITFFLPRIFDAITDPIMGYISDNTKSRWGRRRHYVFMGAVLMGISFVAMWQLYREDGVTYIFYYFVFWSFIFYLGLTLFSVPYVAIGYEMSNDFHERTSIMAIAQFIGQWAWVIAPWFWVIMYDKGWFESADVATRTLAVWVGVACAIFAMIPAIFIPGKSSLHENYAPLTFRSIGFSLKEIFMGFKEAFASEPFRKLCIATFFIFNAFNTIASFSFFIIVYHLFNGDAGASGVWPTLFGSLGALSTTFLVIPLVARMSKKLGKKRAFLLSQSISILGYILFWFLFVPGKPYMFIFALPLFSFGIGSLFTIMMSMTADVIDLDELNTGKRREGIFGAIYWWMVKVGFAIAGLLSGTLMTLVGFDPSVAVQPEGAITGLRIFFSGIPIFGTLIAIYVMRNYDVDEARANEIRAELDKRKAPTSKPTSSLYPREKFLPPGAIPVLASDTDFSSKSIAETRELFTTTLNRRLHGICFSPYMEGQNIGDQLSRQQIERRMSIVAPYAKWIRSFSCTDGNENIPPVAHAHGLQTMAGAWIDEDRANNDKEIDALIALARQGHVDIAVVGNEVLLRGDISKQELLHYIRKVKQALPNIPVGYVDVYYQFSEHPELVDACDLVLINGYPFWEGCPIGQASGYLSQMYGKAVSAARGKKVIITETGWPDQGSRTGEAEPSSENAMQYFINVQNWANQQGIELFYFSSFDESWKVRHEGDVGQAWGLWDKNEKPKYK